MKNLEDYLKENIKRGIIDHSLRADVTKGEVASFYIHPAQVSGDTLDYIVHGDQLIPKQEPQKDGNFALITTEMYAILHSKVSALLLENVELRDENEKLKKQAEFDKILIQDFCGDGIEIKKLALPFLGEFAVYGDSFGVPSAVDVVEQLCEEIKRLSPKSEK